MSKPEIIKSLDLRIKPAGCSQHPLIKLRKFVEKLSSGEGIKVVTDESIIPVSTLRVIAKRKGLKLEILRQEDRTVELVLYRD
ncbi:MAG: hypothetical protein ABWW65_02135 [Thermoprotei archaeon]